MNQRTAHIWHQANSVRYLKTDNCVQVALTDKCHPKIFKRVAKVMTSKATHDRAVIQRTMHGEEFKNYARLRNGVETVPSIIRNNYPLENMPRGKQR